MANINAVSVPVAVEHKTKLDLSFDHVTTMGFCRVQPVIYRRMIRGEHDIIKCETTVRPAPIEVPFFGSCVQNIRYFAVKLSTIFPNWYNFINDNIASNYSNSSIVSGVPLLPNATLVNLFTYQYYDHGYYGQSGFVLGLFRRVAMYSAERTIDGVTYPEGYYTTTIGYFNSNDTISDALTLAEDFYHTDNYFDYECAGTRFQLEHIGRRFMTVLNSLGYRVIWCNTKTVSFDYNCLNLLALLRVYLDWYSNSQYLNTASVLAAERLFKYNDPTGQLVLTHSDLFNILHLTMLVVYDTDDYYVNAWDNPQAAVGGQFSPFAIVDPTSNNGVHVATNSNGSPEMQQPANNSTSIGTAYIHEALKRLTDYQKRHQLSARSIDRALAQFGAIPTNLKNERSIYLGHQSNVIKTGSVMATANGSNGDTASSVGDYAGAGYGQSVDSIEYTAEDDCILIGLATIIPLGKMVQGYDRINRAIVKADFFNPEFDFGVKAIEKGEVYTSNVDTFAGDDGVGNSDYVKKFGFTGQYGELKRPKSFLTGDLANERINQGAGAWHLFRLFDDNSFGGSAHNIEHSISFTRSEDALQYYRVFQYTGEAYDPFQCFMHFDFAAIAPCRPLFDTYDFETEGAKKVDISNGNKVN